MTPAPPTPDHDWALRVQNLNVTLNGVPVLVNVNCTLPRGQLSAIIGPNGAGKTTLLRAILGIVPYSGRVDIGRNARGNPLKLGYVPQRLDFDRGMPLSVEDFMCCSLQRSPLWLGCRGRVRRRAIEAISRVGGSATWLPRRLGRLSGGELQRVLVATALSIDPDILLLDEPVSGVDVAGEEMFCDLLASVQNQTGCSMLLVSHDLSIVTQHAHHVICLNQAVQCQGATVETLTADNLKALYHQHVGLYAHSGTHEGHAHDHSCGADH